MSNYPAPFVVVDGERWDLYGIEYRHEGKTFGVYIYARSESEAHAMTASLKASGHVEGGSIVGFCDHEPTQAEMEAFPPHPTIH